MILLSPDFMLNKTEFIAYLHCPFQFYLLKELQNSKRKRFVSDPVDYEPFLRAGIEKHHWFQNFHNTFGDTINDMTCPLLDDFDISEEWKAFFVEFELKRYKQNPILWKPLAVELFLTNDLFCGKIDRIDLLDQNGHCRIVEYKSQPSEFDEQELLFYASLLTDCLLHESLPTVTQVTEIGVYYYTSGEFWLGRIIEETLQTFQRYVSTVRENILNPSAICKKKSCNPLHTRCLYHQICQRIRIHKQ